MLFRFLKAIGAFFLDFIETAVMALFLFVIVYLFLFQPHQVKGNSMYPNYHDGEYLLTNKFVYYLNPPARNDVIVFKAPQNDNYDYIKRVIAIPGDTIKIAGGKVFLNDRLLDESSYLGQDVKTSAGMFLEEAKVYKLADNEFFVMGDNRSHSSDSREWGPVPKQNIIGKAWLRYWPPAKIGLL